MKKNAFTLIEILAAIVIMGILSTIIVTASIRKVNQARENSYKTLINSIELSAKNYVVDNENNLDDFLNNDWINISLQTLVDNKYLNNIKNPKTNKDLPLTDIVYVTRNYDGKIEATYDIEQDNKNKLTLSGAYNIYIKENSTYNDPGILLNDNLLNSGVTITGEVNTSIVKKYQITYQYNGKTLKRNIIIYSDNTADTPIIKTVTLTINEEGGTLKNNISGSYRVGKTLSIESPTKDNCIFEGWEITSSKNDYNLTNNILTIGSENITLKAKWKKNQVTLVKYITNLYNDESTRTSNGLKKDNTVDTNIRYYGSDPNNYVSFNDELWRVVGIFEVSKENNGTKEKRVKLIRDDYLPKLSWDSSASNINNGYGVNEWSQADLKNFLNTMYYGGTSVTCYGERNNQTTTCPSDKLNNNSKNLIEKAVWNTAGVDEVKNLNTKDIYNFERTTKTGKACSGGSDCNDNVNRTTSWTGYVALPYVSDWIYASGEAECQEKYVVDTSTMAMTCASNNWIDVGNSFINDATHFLSPRRDTATAYINWAIYVGGFINGSYASSPYYSYPTVYLKSNTFVTGGTGTSNDPYKLTL